MVMVSGLVVAVVAQVSRRVKNAASKVVGSAPAPARAGDAAGGPDVVFGEASFMRASLVSSSGEIEDRVPRVATPPCNSSGDR